MIPKPLGDQLGFSPDILLEAEVMDGRLELSAQHDPAKLVKGPHGPEFKPTDIPIDDEDVRHALEAVRERR